MQFIAYILIYPFLWLISILPFKVLYMLSDGLYVLLYYIIGYRKKTVKENLKLVFPEKSEQERNSIAKKFYHHLCDMFLEMIKSMTAPKSKINKRFIIKNPEEINRLESLNKSIILMYGHYASYEWSMVLENYVTYKGVAIYKRINNKYFDALVRRIRSKYNTTLVTTKNAISKLNELKKKDIKIVGGFLSDQSPKLNKAYHWTNFMGITVPCFTGAEMLAKKLDHSVAFLKVEKVKRGFYEGEIVTLADDASKYKDYEITDAFTRTLEAQIKAKPEYYLWTHKRWKHRNNVPEAYKHLKA